MALKLFVDDMRAEPAGWHLATTVSEAIRVLALQDVEEVSLDHDIMLETPHDGGIVSARYARETFEGVAWYIAAMPPERRPKRVRLHSGNNTGRNRMESIVRRAGIPTVNKMYEATTEGEYA